MSDICTVIRKELSELKHSSRHLYWLLTWLGVLAILKWGNHSRSLLPIASIYSLIPIFVALGVGGQIVFDSILGEKKAKTLEVLLSTRMSTSAIVIGKIVPAVGVGYVLSQLATLALILSSVTETTLAAIWLMVVVPILAAYIGSSMTIAMTILVPDEKVVPMIGTLILVAPLLVLLRLGGLAFSPVGMSLITAGAVLFCGCITWLAALALRRIPLIARI
jgi:ABC-type Na+ efflux pump permease subunit